MRGEEAGARAVGQDGAEQVPTCQPFGGVPWLGLQSVFLGHLEEIQTLACPCLSQANCTQGGGSGEFLARSQCAETGQGLLVLLLKLTIPEEHVGHPVSLLKAV